MLRAEEILSVRSVLGDRGRDPVAVPGAPGVGGEVAAGVADTFLLDLEPVARAIIGLDVVIGGPGQVDKTGTCRSLVSLRSLPLIKKDPRY